jgi:hypothetical protein
MQSQASTELAATMALGSTSEDSLAEPAPPGIAELLAHAARLAAAEGGELDEFMRAAWSAFVDARPGLREHFEQMRLAAEFEQLRQSGRMPMA